MASQLSVTIPEPAKRAESFAPGTDLLDKDGREHSVHYPMPSDSLNDPLSWSTKWKHWTYAQVLFYLFFSILPGFAMGSIYGTLIEEYGMSATEISQSSSWYLLILALGGFVMLPFANAFGRKPLLLISNMLNIAGLIWLTQSKTHAQFVWSRNLSALGSTAIEWIGLAIVGDCFFTEEAGFYHAVGFAPFIIASYIGSPLVGAFDQSGAGWRNFFWMCIAFLILTQFLLAFFLPETLWTRTNASTRGFVTIVETKPGPGTVDTQEAASPSSVEDDRKGYLSAVIDNAEDSISLRKQVLENIGKGSPSIEQRRVLSFKLNLSYSLPPHLFDIAVLSTFGPIVLFGFAWAAIGGSANGMGFIASPVWSAPPYNFSTAAIGCTNIPLIVGTLLGFVAAGPLIDADVARRARKNDGVREPEMRLPIAIISSLAIAVTLFIYAVGLQHQWHWAAILVPGAGLNAFATSFAVVAISTYATDCYKSYAMEIGFITTIWKNLWTFGLGYFINDLYERVGALRMVALISIPLFVFILCCVLFLWIGKPLRVLSGKTSLMQRK